MALSDAEKKKKKKKNTITGFNKCVIRSEGVKRKSIFY